MTACNTIPLSDTSSRDTSSAILSLFCFTIFSPSAFLTTLLSSAITPYPVNKGVGRQECCKREVSFRFNQRNSSSDLLFPDLLTPTKLLGLQSRASFDLNAFLLSMVMLGDKGGDQVAK